MTKYINTRKIMGDAKFYEGYSRFDDSKNRYEHWNEAVDRVMATHRKKYADKLTPELEEYFKKAETLYKSKRVVGSSRALQYGGDQLLANEFRLYNCAATYADRPEFFGEVFFLLLSGCGVGVSVQKHHVNKLPLVRPRTKQPKTHVIEDSIEGWSTALDVLMSSFFIGGGKHPEYEGRRVYFDANKVRKKGAYISGGFKAPGPEPLLRALNLIERILTENAEDGILKPIRVYDICMHAADAVLAGGVRRSATIFIFSPDDDEMMTAKTGNWFEENPQRARSNNSAMIVRSDVTREQFSKLMKNIKEFGEPGFFFTNSTEHMGNPCLEIGFLPTFEGKSGIQLCNLSEINGSKCNTREEFLENCEAAAILGTIQAGYTNFKFVSDVTKHIVEREALLGVSITGWMNNPDVLFNEEILKEGAELVKYTNKKIAKLLGINPAARATCVKPSGNVSTTLGTASGIHPEHSKHYIRHVQMNKQSEVAQLIKKLNPYMTEESVWSANKTDYVVSFPIVSPTKSIYKNDLNALQFLEKVKLVQQSWIEYGTDLELCTDPTLRHNVSNTTSVSDDEWDDVEEYIFNNKDYFTGISMFSASGEKDYFQASFTEVLTENEIIDKYGKGSLFASGLIVDSLTGFNNLWEACYLSQYDTNGTGEIGDIRHEWKRRFKKFAENYFDSDYKKADHCLKDVYILHKWTKIQQNYKEIEFETLEDKKYIDIDQMGAIACAGGACEI